MQEGLERLASGSVEQRQYQDAKLALLLQLCQTRDGAKYVLQANLFRAIEMSQLFSADPELQIGMLVLFWLISTSRPPIFTNAVRSRSQIPTTWPP